MNTLPTELVERIMDTKSELELTDTLTQLKRKVDHTDLPLMKEFPYMSNLKRIELDKKYLDMFSEYNLLYMYNSATYGVLHKLDFTITIPNIDNIYESMNVDLEPLHNGINERFQMIRNTLMTKYGLNNQIEADIIGRRLVNELVKISIHFPLRGLYTRYKNLFKRKDFTLRFYND